MLFGELSYWFDGDDLFFDRDGIDEGEAFPDAISQALESARMVLVLVGPQWLSVLNERAGRGGVDYVRHEVATALARHAQSDGVKVQPVRLGGALMPCPAEFDERLRQDLSALCLIDAFELVDGKQADWRMQFERLLARIEQASGLKARFRLPAGVEAFFRTLDQPISPHFADPHGRVTQLRVLLTARTSSANVSRVAIYGMGGLGKTQLALKYSHEYRDSYLGVWWFRAQTEVTLEVDASQACRDVGATRADHERASVAFARWLDRVPGPWLVVYDNAEDGAMLRPHLPFSQRHHVLITSRNPGLCALVPADGRLELEHWSDGQAGDFLQRRGVRGTRAQQLELGQEFGGLPLALEHAANYLDETGIDLAEYLALYRKVTAQLLGRGEVPGYPHSVAAALTLSFEKLTPAAQQLLRLLVQGAPEPVPERWFTQRHAALAEPLAAAAADALAWNDVAGELRRYAYVRRGVGVNSSEWVFTLHRLTIDVLRTRFTGIEEARGWLRLIDANLPTEYNLPALWPLWSYLAPHVAKLGDRDELKDARTAATLARLAASVARYLAVGPASYEQACRFQEIALRLFERFLGHDHLDTITAMDHLGSMRLNQGDITRARLLQQQAMNARQRLLGREHPHTLGSIHNLGTTLRVQGDYEGARVLQQLVVAERRRLLGEDHLDTLSSMSTLAATLWHLGDLAHARSLLEQVLEAHRRLLGEEHPETLISMSELASTISPQGAFADARVLQEQVLDAHRRLLGEEHPTTLTSMNNLGVTLRHLGNLAGSRAIHERVLAADRRVRGPMHPETLRSMSNLAHTLYAIGEVKQAVILLEQTIIDRKTALGANHPDVADAQTTLQGWLAGDDGNQTG